MPVLAHSCFLGESPLWDDAQQLICWVDIVRGEIHQYSPQSEEHTVITTGQMVGAIGLCDNGHFIAALQNGFGFIDRATGQVRIIQDPEAGLPNNRFNDGKCAPDGRFWAGTLSFDEIKGAGSVYCLQPGMSVIKKMEHVTISNGLAWNANRSIMYYIDSPTQQIVAYRYDAISGNISNPQTVVTVPAGEGAPDGMTIDTEDMLWTACWGGSKVVRWDPHTGKKLLEIMLPVSHVSCCCFGGPLLQDLYITTAVKDLSPAQLKDQPLAGKLFVVENCGFTGLATNLFTVQK